MCVMCAAFLLHCGAPSSSGRGKPKRGSVYIVKRGDTLSKIAHKVSLSYQYLAEFNNIENPALIRVGQKIYIPKRGERPGKKPRKPRGTTTPADETDPPIHTDRGRFVWPIGGTVTSLFGPRDNGATHHDGIDIVDKTGTPIVAAADGVVAFSGEMRGYGNLIVIEHKDHFYTAYAHNSENKVKKGDRVKRGKTVVGKVGSTGRASGPHLHFEVRYRDLARNPLFYLPKR